MGHSIEYTLSGAAARTGNLSINIENIYKKRCGYRGV